MTRRPPRSTLFPYTTLFRSLQFNSKNVANVFDDLSIAGGRFATLIQFAKRNKLKQGTAPQPKGEGVAPEAECAIDHDEQFLGRSEEHTSELQSHSDLVCRLLLEKKNVR